MKPRTAPIPWALLRWFLSAAWQLQRGRWLLAAGAVAVGIALATAVHTVNRSALDEFRRAIDSINGESTHALVAKRQEMDERLFDKVLEEAHGLGILAASPVLSISAVPHEARATDAVRESAPETAITVLGIDIFNAAQVTPTLMPKAEEVAGADSPLLADDTVFLSPAARALVGERSSISLKSRELTVRLKIAGSVAAPPGVRLAVMDLGAAQWRFNRVGELSRIDIKFTEGADVARALTKLNALAPQEAEATQTAERTQRMSNLSRAYRVNLNVLALVALFTGLFIVFATVGLAAVRQRAQLALVSVLGASRGFVALLMLSQGVLVAVAGSVLGIGVGLGLAQALLSLFGGDLGGGYFPGARPTMSIDVAALVLLFALGVLTGLLASALPAWELAHARPAEALRSGSTERGLDKLRRGSWVLGLFGLALVLLLLPPIDGLPYAAYAAIACLLVGTIAAVPWLSAPLFSSLAKLWGTRTTSPLLWLALQRAAQASGQASGVIAGLTASFALTVAMVVMVMSFRGAVSDWLVTVLPADVYVRATGSSDARISPEAQALLTRMPGVARIDFGRDLDVSLEAARPRVGVLVRDFDASAPQSRLPLTGAVLPAPAGSVPLYVSEAMVDLYGFAPGARVSLPLKRATDGAQFHVSGVYRDYARQHGSVTLSRGDYKRLTGDDSVNQAALVLGAQASLEEVMSAIQAKSAALGPLEFRSASELRALSLTIFDRSFAMTYLLEAAAIIVGLFGVISSYGAQALARVREFSVLKHLGLPREQIVRLIAIEGALLSSFGALLGALAGLVIGVVLIDWVNPQSFHWTMAVRVPWGQVLGGALLLGVSGMLAAAWAVHSAARHAPLDALKEDW